MIDKRLREILYYSEDCPNCNNVGYRDYPESEKYHGKVERGDCECQANPKSKFNIPSQIKSLVIESLGEEKEIGRNPFDNSVIKHSNCGYNQHIAEMKEKYK